MSWTRAAHLPEAWPVVTQNAAVLSEEVPDPPTAGWREHGPWDGGRPRPSLTLPAAGGHAVHVAGVFSHSLVEISW